MYLIRLHMETKCRFLLVVSMAFMFAACSEHKVSSTREYVVWLNNVDNECKVSKKVGDMVVTVKYLPPSFLALKEYELSDHKVSYDSLFTSYKNSITFVMSFETKQGQEGDDVMYKDLSTYKEYVERSMTLNFDLESKVVLQAGPYEYAPVLSSLENTYGLSKGRDVYFVFSSKEKDHDLLREPVLDVIYKDDIYNIGILHYTYDFKSLQKKLPIVELKK